MAKRSWHGDFFLVLYTVAPVAMGDQTHFFRIFRTATVKYQQYSAIPYTIGNRAELYIRIGLV